MSKESILEAAHKAWRASLTDDTFPVFLDKQQNMGYFWGVSCGQ